MTDEPRRIRFSEASALGVAILAVVLLIGSCYAASIVTGLVPAPTILAAFLQILGIVSSAIGIGLAFRRHVTVDLQAGTIQIGRRMAGIPVEPQQSFRFVQVESVEHATDSDGNETVTVHFVNGHQLLVMSGRGLQAVLRLENTLKRNQLGDRQTAD